MCGNRNLKLELPRLLPIKDLDIVVTELMLTARDYLLHWCWHDLTASECQLHS